MSEEEIVILPDGIYLDTGRIVEKISDKIPEILKAEFTYGIEYIKFKRST